MANHHGTRRNNQPSNSRRNDYQLDRGNSQLFQRRPARSNSRDNRYLDSHTDHYMDGHSDRYMDSLKDRQSDNVTDRWNNRLFDNRNELDSRNSLLDSRNDHLDGRNNRLHLEKQYDEYISELESKSHYSDLGRISINSDLGRSSRLMDFDRNTLSNFGTNDRFADLERSSVISNLERNKLASGLGQNNPMSIQSDRLLELERNNLRRNLGSSSITPWQVGVGPVNNSNHLPLDTVNKVASTLELANNIISLFQQQPQQNTIPSLLDLSVHAPQSNTFNSGIRGNSIGNRQRSASVSRSAAGKRKANWATAGQSQQSKNFPKKDNNSFKAKPKTSDQSSSNTGKPKKNENKETNYDYSGILSNLLNCHICKKSGITEPKSFAIHLKGKGHAAMMKKTAQEYAMTADKMREEIRAMESKKPNNQSSLNFHCSMCNIEASNAKEHRSSIGHRKLKRYLHPSCNTCNQNFSTRIDFDEHILTVEHLKIRQSKADLPTPQKPEPAAPKVLQISNMDMEKVYVRERFERKKRAKKDDGDSKEQNENKRDDEAKVITESENLVLDYVEGDDLTGVTRDMIPSYNTERSVGDSFLSEFRCVQCNLCNKLFDNEATAKVHLRTWGHHKQFTRLILNKIKSTEEDDDQNKYSENTGGKRQNATEKSGNWKRRKTSDQSFVVEKKVQGDKEIPENDKKSNRHESPGSQLPPNEELEDWDQLDDDKIDIKQEKDDYDE